MGHKNYIHCLKISAARQHDKLQKQIWKFLASDIVD